MDKFFAVKKKAISIKEIEIPQLTQPGSYLDQLTEAVEHYVVARDGMKTVIAGYPWFLDWGRDTLICCRGLISAGFLKDVKKYLFALLVSKSQNSTKLNSSVLMQLIATHLMPPYGSLSLVMITS